MGFDAFEDDTNQLTGPPRPPFGGPPPTFGPSTPSKSKRWGTHYHIHRVSRLTLTSAVTLMNRWLWRNSKRIQPITMSYHVDGTGFSILLFYKRIEVKG